MKATTEIIIKIIGPHSRSITIRRGPHIVTGTVSRPVSQKARVAKHWRLYIPELQVKGEIVCAAGLSEDYIQSEAKTLAIRLLRKRKNKYLALSAGKESPQKKHK